MKFLVILVTLFGLCSSCFSSSVLDKVASGYFNLIFNQEQVDVNHVREDLHSFDNVQQIRHSMPYENQQNHQMFEDAFAEVIRECNSICSDYCHLPEIREYDSFIKKCGLIFPDLTPVPDKFNLISILQQINKKTRPHLDDLKKVHSYFKPTEDILSLVAYACRKQSNPITLTTSDIINQSTTSLSPENIFEIDLSDSDGNDSIIYNYFLSNSLCNLRNLILPSNNSFAFINRIFPNGEDDPYAKQIKYFSLLQIKGHGNITESDLTAIATHFAGYNKFVRDMSQFSERDNCISTFLFVLNVAENRDLEWLQGGKRVRPIVGEPDRYLTYYRVGNPLQAEGPFIIKAVN